MTPSEMERAYSELILKRGRGVTKSPKPVKSCKVRVMLGPFPRAEFVGRDPEQRGPMKIIIEGPPEYVAARVDEETKWLRKKGWEVHVERGKETTSGVVKAHYKNGVAETKVGDVLEGRKLVMFGQEQLIELSRGLKRRGLCENQNCSKMAQWVAWDKEGFKLAFCDEHVGATMRSFQKKGEPLRWTWTPILLKMIFSLSQNPAQRVKHGGRGVCGRGAWGGVIPGEKTVGRKEVR